MTTVKTILTSNSLILSLFTYGGIEVWGISLSLRSIWINLTTAANYSLSMWIYHQGWYQDIDQNLLDETSTLGSVSSCGRLDAPTVLPNRCLGSTVGAETGHSGKTVKNTKKKGDAKIMIASVPPSRVLVLSCAHYFQGPATQATKIRTKR